MDEMVYLAMTGAKQTEYAQAINSNNLANVSTTGFRADLHSFSSAPIDGPGKDLRKQLFAWLNRCQECEQETAGGEQVQWSGFIAFHPEPPK